VARRSNTTPTMQGEVTTMAAIPALAFLYCVAAVLPLAVAAHADTELLRPSLSSMADAAALVAIAILALQFVLSARIRWVERPVGLDRLYRFHRAMAVVAVALLCAHPLLLAAGEYGWTLLLDLSSGWKLLLGKCALAVLLVIALTSLFRAALRLRFGAWLTIHNCCALAVLAGGLVHSLAVGPHCGSTVMRVLWVLFAATALCSYLHRRLWKNLHAPRLTVMRVALESPSVWTVQMALARGAGPYSYLPGQFHFVTLHRSVDRRREEHPFTISSSPTEVALVSSTIKASGDYTATIGATLPGDVATLDGPYGRFSYLLHPGERQLVFVAGGIGITPFMSMLRHMRDTSADTEVVLFYANRTEQDIVFRDELGDIARGGRPRLNVIHILSNPDVGWAGERGRVSVERIRAACGDLGSRSYYICGPRLLTRAIVAGLRSAGVARGRIRFEDFAL
jgi:predicted ferric reductase